MSHVVQAIGAALIGAGDPHAPDDDDKPLLLTLDTLRRRDWIKDDAVEARARLIFARISAPCARHTYGFGEALRCAR
jgi:hypothetical protein